MMRKTVYLIDGPGQSPREGLASKVGEIVGEESNIIGDSWIVEWEDGHREPVEKGNIIESDEMEGIGIYC